MSGLGIGVGAIDDHLVASNFAVTRHEFRENVIAVR
jgi:hypothetical protein